MYSRMCGASPLEMILRDGGHHLVEIAEGGEHGRARNVRPWVQLDDDFGGQARGVPSEPMISWVRSYPVEILDVFPTGPDDLAGRQHGLPARARCGA